MIKTVINYVEKELTAAEEYVESAYMKKAHCPTTADLFLSLAGEELVHAERLIRQGQSLADKLRPAKDSESYEHDLKCMAVWEWSKEKATARIARLKAEMSGYKLL